MNLRVIPFALLVLGASVALSTCTANGGSIFYTIENEQKVGSSTLPKYLVIADIAAAVSGGPYYIAAGGVFQGTMSGTTASISWNPNSDSATSDRPFNPKASDGTIMLCNAMTALGSSLYGGFYTSSGSQFGLYSAPLTTPTTASWTALSLPTTGEQVTLLQTANGVLFVGGTVVGSSSNTYELDYIPVATVVQTGLTAATLTTPITGVVYDSASTKYFVATTNKVYSSGAADPAFAARPDITPTLASGDQINGIYAASGYVFVLTKIGGLYYSSNAGGTWANIAAPQPTGSSSTLASLLCMTGPYGSGSTFFIGTDGYGYYTYTVSGGSLTRFSDTTIALYSDSVRRIFIDGTHIFMGTNATGLWGGELNTDASVSAWTLEQKS